MRVATEVSTINYEKVWQLKTHSTVSTMFFMVLLCTRSQVLEAKHEAEIVRIKAKQKIYKRR
jgi:hypothetical protein